MGRRKRKRNKVFKSGNETRIKTFLFFRHYLNSDSLIFNWKTFPEIEILILLRFFQIIILADR
jgi:hypothetical protein